MTDKTKLLLKVEKNAVGDAVSASEVNKYCLFHDLTFRLIMGMVIFARSAQDRLNQAAFLILINPDGSRFV